MSRAPRLVALMAVLVMAGGLAPAAEAATVSATIRVTATVAGPAPRIGYNLGHFMAGSNAADRWRYAGVRHARAFVSVSDVEPTDDLGAVGDGVTTESGFATRRGALRANAAGTAALDPQYVNWTAFVERYRTVVGDTNRFTIDHAFATLAAAGTDVLANITASPSRFPLASATDWAGAWELWQHYYAQAFLLSSRYGVHRFSMFNEPNNWAGMTADAWLLRLRICSDAVQAGVADAAARYGTGLVAVVYAPTTANGATKFAEWGAPAIGGRHQRWAAAADPAWSNLHVYSYQKYSMFPFDSGTSSGYGTDWDALRAQVDAATAGDTPLPLALTEFNVRTGAQYDATTATLDSPSDFTALAANAIVLANRGVADLYAFKFAQTERTGGTYPVAKNGTHWAQNATTGVNNYGGATRGGEAWRLVARACPDGASRLVTTSSATGLWALACREADTGVVHLLTANTTTNAHTLTLALGDLGLPNGARAVISEVSAKQAGGVVAVASVALGAITRLTLPAQAVWEVRIAPGAQAQATVAATADTVLADGVNKNAAGGGATTLAVRDDGAPDRRRVAVIRIPVSGTTRAADRVLLALRASNAARSGTFQAHVYGLADDGWTEGAATWKLAGFLLQGVDAGTTIAANVVAGQGVTASLLGQLVTSSTSYGTVRLDVTDFVRAQTDGFATFLVVQDHRWDVAIPSLATGDVQADGLRIASREAGSSSAPRLEVLAGL